MFGFLKKQVGKVSLTDAAVQTRRRRLSAQPDRWMSENARVTIVSAIVDDQPDWDYAQDNEKAFEYAQDAAIYYGISTHFNDEQQKLVDFLVANFAGPKIAVYAWGVYLDICGTDEVRRFAAVQ